MPGLVDLIGSMYGPFPCAVTHERVAAFTAATGEDPARWDVQAPPMLANAALFAVAPAFLDDPEVVPYTTSLLHSEQTFEWLRPLEIGERLDVSGTVENVRVRRGLNLVSFRIDAGSDQGAWLRGSATFVMSQEAAATAAEMIEPPEDDRPPFDRGVGNLPLPDVGESLVDLRRGAARSDLMRYAAASQDWNPIHFDHDAALAAGLGGVVVHGLLMAAWLGGLAGRYGPLASLRLRFRAPLRPATPVTAGGSVVAVEPDGAELDLILHNGDEKLVTGRAAVTL